MFAVDRCELPDDALLRTYTNAGAYTDCYTTTVSDNVSLSDFIRAFYTTMPFRMERKILAWALSKPSTDEQADLLAEARTDEFAAWSVEGREANQLLMSDFKGRTRSWLRVDPEGHDHDSPTRLFFGSAVVPISDGETGEARMGATFHALMPFHRLYSQILLSSARDRLSAKR